MGVLWSKSGFIERDNNDIRAAGAIANFFVGGTTTPLTVYEDADETTAHATDVEADANGRWPAVFIPFTTSYDVRVLTSEGTQLYYYLEIPNPDPVEASEDSVDASELIATGDVIFRFADETRTGFVRANARTIGNAASGATERANADTEDLFTFLWNKLANGQAAVSGGRGASAAADYAANKTIALPDLRGAMPIGLDDMGNSAAGVLAAAIFTSGDNVTPGSLGGGNTQTLTTSHIPGHTHTFSATSSSDGSHTHTASAANESAHTHSLTTGTAASGGAHTHSVTDPGHVHTEEGVSNTNPIDAGTAFTAFIIPGVTQNTSSVTTGISIDSGGAHTHSLSGSTAAGSAHTHTLTVNSGGAHTHSISGTSGSTGSGLSHNNVSRCITGTYYIKL